MIKRPLAPLTALSVMTVAASVVGSGCGCLGMGAAFAATARQITTSPTSAFIAFPAPEGGGIVLYDQSSPPGLSGAYYVNADPPPDQAYASEGADDFEVTDPGGWNVTEFRFSASFVQESGLYTGTPNYNVNVYPDAAGVPGETALCGGNDIPGVRQNPTSNNGIVVVPMPGACLLPAGHYWVGFSTVVVVPPSGLWGFNGAPADILDPAMWRNPGGSMASGCPTWTPALICLGGFSGGFPAFNFQVVGNVGEPVDEIFASGFESVP